MPVSMILQWERRILSEEMSHLLQDAAYAAVSQRYPSGILTPDATSPLADRRRWFNAKMIKKRPVWHHELRLAGVNQWLPGDICYPGDWCPPG